ncbi:TonB-dependent receptor [uncultured Bacteroides sp.]|uniref:SusC/RagA family TonB-linked outer membrane protein n=1 Tax=uncultured Bacteroides sp. TaxID=162156 RepID=UPI0025E4AD0D|nr:TonB-dependent receptor [uncultured Bacteroides sp.]
MKSKILNSNGKFLLLCLVGMLMTVQGFAQSITVNGVVKDKTGEPVIGANVVVKGTTNGTITDFDGVFTLQANKGDVIVISFIGYQPQELQAAEQINVILQDDTQLLEDVVVIGYGTVKKSDLSGSVVAIKAEEMNKGAVTSPQELMMGKVPGLSISQGDGGPGSGSTIRIRSGASLNASNDPLIVIDGIPVSNDAAPGTSNALGTINPNDIETFTVLKDASATAIYGSRASNGVIIITTKKGTQDKIKVSYNSTYAYKDPYQRFETMSAKEFRNAVTTQYLEGTALGDAAREIINLYPNQSTDWQDAIFQGGMSTDQNIAVSGKVGFLPFRVSFGYNKERGTLKTSDYERYTASLNLSPKFFDNHLSVDINVKGTINNNRFADSGAVGSAAFYDPTKPVYGIDPVDPATYSKVYNYNGYWNWSNGENNPNTLSAVNPLSLLYDRDNSGTTKRSLGNIQLDYKIHGFEDLRVNLNLGYDVAKTTGHDYANPGSYQSARDTDFKNIGQGKDWNNIRRNLLLDFYMNYDKNIESIQSNINVMAGYSWQHFYYKDHNLFKSNVMDNNGEKDGWTYNETEGKYIKNNSYPSPWENYLVSFFGRLNYSLMDRYLLTATLRNDGSSRFNKNNRWGLFPSAALAWSIINEPFMEKARDFMSNLKLRIGYGVTGQQEIGDYQYIVKYVLSTNPNTMYLNNYLLKPDGYSPNLKWEETTTYNVGIDYGFLNNRINGSIEYYQKHTKDLLNKVNVPAGSNYINEIIANVGSMKNEGVEFNINATAIQTKDFAWELGYNITWNTSKITKLTAVFNPAYEGIEAGSASYGSGTVLQRHQVGYAPYTFWLFQQVYDEDGKPVQNALVDRNNDGKIGPEDRYFTNKSPMADFYMGLSSQFTYKNWDLGFNMRASIGNYVYNAKAADLGSLNSFTNQGSISNYYRPAIEQTGFTLTSSAEQKASDLFLENASYLKMDNITLGYTFKKFFTDKISGRISASVQNVFTITKYSGMDPECSSIDENIWPRPRTFTLGLNLNF